jgi:hypothetical protein
MSLNRGELNPLSVLEQRKLNFIPEHFSKITVNRVVDSKLLDHWLNFNLNSRYAFKKSLVLDHNKRMVEVLEIGLEDPKEILVLTLGCTLIHGHNEKEII